MRIYLIMNGEGLCKIGYTRRSINNRIKELQTGSPTDLQAIHVYETDLAQKLEPIIHRFYGSYRMVGEWFNLPPEEINNFPEMVKRTESNIKMLRDAGNQFV